MEINKFIKCYDSVLPWDALSVFIRYINTAEFNVTGTITNTGEQTVDTNIRKTSEFSLYRQHKSLTNVHWFSVFEHIIGNKLLQYQKDLSVIEMPIHSIISLSVLKYTETSHYVWHTDHSGVGAPRTYSTILFLNNDYEGGNLWFRDPDGSNEMKIETKANRLIIWPSNFLFPHTVKPVTKGTRYSLVSWWI